jgi:hypothetical protein
MKESYIEDLVNHDDPESCVYYCEAIDEALTGAHTGRVLSRENRQTRMLTSLSYAESEMNRYALTSINSILRGRRPLACMEISCARTGIPHRPLQGSVERVGKVITKANNERW